MSNDRWQNQQIPALLLLLAVTGCASLPFKDNDRTSLLTPRMRMAAIQESALRAKDSDSAEQQKTAEQLATQIQTEPDPLVRRSIQEAMGELSVPLAQDVLIAGLKDDDLAVRLTCCQELGKRADPSVIVALSERLQNDDQLDVKLAAIDALGQIKSPQSVSALATAVNDRDPALQFAGVQALQAISGKELGNDVAAWREYAASAQPEISLAERPRGWSPF